MARISTEYNFVGSASTGPLESLGSPSGVAVTFFGASGGTTYGYRISALNNYGETLASSSISLTEGNASLSASNFNRIVWNRVLGANSYKVYGRTLNSELFMASISSNVYFDDTGTVTPSGALPLVNTTGYSSSRTSMGDLMTQKTGLGENDNWVGPFPVAFARPVESSPAIPTFMPHAIRWSTEKDWIFFADNAAAANTRRIFYAVYNRSNNNLALEGFITLGFAVSNTAHTTRGFRMTYDTYNTGSILGVGTTIRGTDTAWASNRIPRGCRIGFGAPDPTYITRWYEISEVTNDNTIQLTAALDVGYASNTPYVIEDLRAIMATTNATVAGGGLNVTKGLRPEIFTVSGITIGVSTLDSFRATYWLRDGNRAPLGLATNAIGMALVPKTGFTTQIGYVLDGVGNAPGTRVHAYNVRAPLAGIGTGVGGFTTGSTFSGWQYSTGAQALTGVAQQTNNGRYGILNHGPGAGVECIYFTTASRVYRAVLSDIVNGTIGWVADCMVEIPPGSANAYAATGALVAVEIADSIDRLIITSTGAAGVRNYVTRYQTFVEQFDIIWGVDTKQLDQSLGTPLAPILPTNILASIFTVWAEAGLTYLSRSSLTAASNQIYAVPFGAHWGLTTNQRIITAAINTPNAISYSKAVIVNVRKFGSDQFAVQSEPYNVYYRTYGITDNSGAWTLLPENGSLTGVSPAAQIQFMIEFKIIGNYCLPARIISMEMIYNIEDSLPSFLQWNFSDSDNADGTVGFIQKGTYGSVPTFQINYYRADNDINLLTQDSTSTTYGNFQFWNGAAWVNGVGTDTDGLRRRFVPTAGLPSNTNVYSKIKVI